jgi:DNA-binding winged helix-turn-helix (wHTH) protein
VFQFGPFQFDVSERRLSRDTLEVPLPHKVFTTLRLLVESGGRLITREQLMAIWPDVGGEEGNLNHVVSIA